jgi:hypothetical protein
LGTLRVIIYWIWAITGIIRDGSHLNVWICETIRKDDRRKVDLGQLENGRKDEFIVLVVDNGSNVGRIRATITFCGKMERQIGVLWEAGDEESEEGVDIHTSDWARIHRRAVRGVRVPDTNRLVKENDVGTLVP